MQSYLDIPQSWDNLIPQLLRAGTSPSNAGILPHPPTAELYFYQATDGQWLFLHPLLMRILLEHYGGYESLPNSLAGTLLEVEPQVQTEALRKRHKFLGHLPLGGES